MSDPEIRSPQEWAQDLREAAEEWASGSSKICREFTATDCREMADRMDDLTEAVQLLRSVFSKPAWSEKARALLDRYVEDEG